MIRVLLQGPIRAWKVAELAKSAKVSLGWASSVRRQLLAHEWAEETADGFRITKPGSVLDAWAKTDDWQKRTETREYSLLVSDPAEIAAHVHRLLGNSRHAFTQWYGAALRHPHTTPPLVTAYVEEWPDEASIKEVLLTRRVESGGRPRLVLPRDEGVFNPLQTVDGFLIPGVRQCDVRHRAAVHTQLPLGPARGAVWLFSWRGVGIRHQAITRPIETSTHIPKPHRNTGTCC